jgi:subtilisin-like proprotein convertase family protein
MKKLLFSALAGLLSVCAFSQQRTSDFWQDVPESLLSNNGATRRIVPNKYRTLSLDLSSLQQVLKNAPLRFAKTEKRSPVVAIPLPDGKFLDFNITEAPVMAPTLAAKYPYMRSFFGWSKDDPTAYLRCGYTQKGFYAILHSARHSTVYIDEYAEGDTKHYISYFKKDYSRKNEPPFVCELDEEEHGKYVTHTPQSPESMAGDCKMRTYSLALACTGEYAQFHGGTVPLVMAEFNEAVARISSIYEKDLGASFVLVANNDQLIFLNASTDPYSNDNNNAMLTQNNNTCNSVIGSANYDIGHVFATGSGGVAYIQGLCSSVKGGGVSAHPNPTGDAFWVDYVCHEMGHQFGGNHTQNNDCNRNGPTAMETGSGVTIMGYAGVCAPNVELHSIDNFHAVSLGEIAPYITTGGGNTCATSVVTGNNAPVANVTTSLYTIPRSTPFMLTCEATDPDGDALTYVWEQMNPQVSTQPPVATSTGGPSFRCFSPTESPTRFFPDIQAILNNTTPQWEVLPSVGRTMNFRCTVRDNFPGAGCTDETDITITVNGSAGPFAVTAPNTAVTWGAGSAQSVTWNVANTSSSPVSTPLVDIFLSIDGGFNYPYTLASAVTNDGSQGITVPDDIPNTVTTARVMVKGHNNVFFDISNVNFTITAPPSFSFAVTPSNVNACQTGTAIYTLDVFPISGFNQPVTFTTSGAPAGATVSISPSPVTPPSLVTVSISNLNNVAAGNYNIAVTGVSGSITKMTNLQLTVFQPIQTAAVLAAPADGATGQLTAPMLSWQPIPNALLYEVEVSESPAFTTLAASAVVASGNYTVTSPLVNGQVYYWRVRGSNPCGTGPFSEVFAFQVGGEQCQTYTPTGLPLTIPDDAVTTVSKTLSVSDNFQIFRASTHVEIDHTWIGDLNATLKSAGNTTLILFDQPGVPTDQFGCSNDDIVATFSDAATNTSTVFENTCNGTPPAISGAYQPVQALSGFVGQNANGTWTLTIGDNFEEDGGALTAWSLELCRLLLPDAAVLLKNNVLTVTKGATEVVSNTYLEADGSQGAPTYILLSLPQNGTLFLLQGGSPVALAIGDEFTQADIDAGNLSYEHNDSNTSSDSFRFDVLTSNLNWLHDQTFQINVIQNTLAATAALTQSVSCNNGTNGVITVTATGGAAPLAYRLNGGAYQSSNVFSNLPAGTYTPEVKDANGFTFTTNSITIANPAAINVSASVNSDDVTVTASGGTGTLQYSIGGGAFQSSNQFNNLANGSYAVVVSDANGCTASTTAIVAVNTLIVSASITENIRCFGGANGIITASVGGGAAPFEYRLNGGVYQSSNVFTGLPAGVYTIEVKDAAGFVQTGNTVTLTNPPALTGSAAQNGYSVVVTASGGTGALQYSLDLGAFQSSNVFMSVSNGSHSIVVRDANGCELPLSITVNVPALSVSATITQVLLCWNSTNGVITATGSGGVAPYTYSINGGAFQSGNVFSNLTTGAYTITIKDSGGITVSAAAVNLIAPPQLTLNASASGYTVTATAGGGTSPYQYRLDNGALQTSNIFNNVPNGTHTVTVHDANGCETTTSVTVSVGAISVLAFQSKTISCFGAADGQITADASGGIPPLTYSLDGVNFQASNTFTGLGAGTYTVIVKDAGGATVTSSQVVLANPPLLTVTASAFGPTVTATGAGGTGTLQYSFNGGPFVAANVFTASANGDFQVQVRDENGCLATTSVNVNAITNLIFTITDVSCIGELDGQIVVDNVVGGVPPYTYSLDGGPFTSQQVYPNLPAGDHTISVQDATGFEFSSNALTISEPYPITFSLEFQTGDILVIHALGGTGSFEYSIDGVNFQSDSTFTNVGPGNYTLVIRDENDCSVTETLIIDSTNDPKNKLAFEVSPNPGSGLFEVKMELPSVMALQAIIYDVSGRVISRHRWTGDASFKQVLDLTALPSGVYVLKATGDQLMGTKRLVKF